MYIRLYNAELKWVFLRKVTWVCKGMSQGSLAWHERGRLLRGGDVGAVI